MHLILQQREWTKTLMVMNFKEQPGGQDRHNQIITQKI